MSAGGEAGPGRIFVTDCEGPLTKNDNAQEIAARFIPDGAAFFARLSKYDDFLVDVAHKQGYNAGNTLRLIPPFFEAFHVSDEDVELFSAEGVLLVPGVAKALTRSARCCPRSSSRPRTPRTSRRCVTSPASRWRTCAAPS